MQTAWCAGCRPGRSSRRGRSRARRRSSARPIARRIFPTRTRTDRCPGTSSAGSRRTAPSRRAASGTTPDARGRRGGRASTGRRCPERCRFRASSLLLRVIQIPRKNLKADGSPCARPPPRRSPRDCPRRPAARRRRCSSPCARSCRWDGPAAGTAHRSPSPPRTASARSGRGSRHAARRRAPSAGTAHTSC